MNKTHDGNFDRTFSPTAEGVAAPLEPTKLTPRLFYESWRCAHYAGITQPWPYAIHAEVCEFAEAYAAAVSKNLSDKYAEMEAKWVRKLLTASNEIGEARASVEQLCGDLKAIQQDYTNEKKRAENLQEELSLMEKKFDSLMADSNAIIKQREARILDLEKEIAALRETK